jgi:hypothetical protein
MSTFTLKLEDGLEWKKESHAGLSNVICCKSTRERKWK